MERKIIETFRQQYEDFPPGEIQEWEKPDFLVVDGDHVIGIELTGYHHNYGNELGDTYLQADKAWISIIQLAQKKFERKYPGIGVSVSFDLPANKLVHRDKKALYISKLVEIVYEYAGVSDNESIPSKYLDMGCEGIESELRLRISVKKIGAKRGMWNLYGAFKYASPMELPYFIATLENIVDAKDGKMSQYQKHCNAVWLIIHTGASIASKLDTVFGVPRLQIETEFDKVLLYDQCENKVFELVV